MQAAQFFNFLRLPWIRRITAQDNVYSPAGHVGRHRHRSRTSCLSDNCSFAFMVFGIQDLMANPRTMKQLRKYFVLLDRNRTDKYRLTGLLPFLNIFHYRVILRLNVFINYIRHILSYHRFIGWNAHHFQVIYFMKLFRRGLGCTRHPRQLFIKPEIILNRNLGKSSRLLLNRHSLFCLNRLVQTGRIPPAKHQSAGKLINNHYLPLPHYIIFVARKQSPRFQARF